MNKQIVNKYESLTAAYAVMENSLSELKRLKNELATDLNKTDFINPLESGPVWDIEKGVDRLRHRFIEFIVFDLSKSEKFKNLIIDPDAIYKHFGIGYNSHMTYGFGFDSIHVITCFDKLYNKDNLEQVISEQILKNARFSIPRNKAVVPLTELERFGKDNKGIVLHYVKSHVYSNTNPTTELMKLLLITYCGESAMSVDAPEIAAGDTITLPCCVIKAFHNEKLKITFNNEYQADEVCKILLGEW